MKDILHEILSELHHILSIASPEELRAASKRSSVSGNMKRALEALARERAESNEAVITKPAEPSSKTTAKAPKVERTRGRQLVSNANINGKEGRLFRLLMTSSRFADKGALRDLVRDLGIDTHISTKDNRERTAKKIARAIQSAPEKQGARLLSVLMETQDDQTQGWIDVIKGSR